MFIMSGFKVNNLLVQIKKKTVETEKGDIRMFVISEFFSFGYFDTVFLFF